MSYKVTRKNEAVKYQPPGHFDVCSTHMTVATDANKGDLTVSVSHFLPGGGCEYGTNPVESIYYILEGEMDLVVDKDTPDEYRTTLHAGDCFHCGPNTYKGIQNNGCIATRMLVVITGPKA